MEIPKIVEVKVTDGIPPKLKLMLSSDVPANSFLRIRASGTAMLVNLKIKDVQVPELEMALPVMHRFNRDEMRRDWTWHINSMSLAVVCVDTDLPAGTTIEVVCDVTGGPKISGLSWFMNIGGVSDPRSLEFKSVSEPLEIRFVPGPVHHLETYLKSDGRLIVEQFDCHGNPTHSDGARLIVTADDEQIELEPSPGIGATTVELTKTAAKTTRVQICDTSKRKSESNARPVAMDGTPIYFGEFHWHTDFSGDGQRSLEDALKSARDELGLDFAGPGDHIGINGRYSHSTPSEQMNICQPFDEPGIFCTIPGAELSARYGHTNLHTDSWDLFVELASRFSEELAPAWRNSPNQYPLAALAKLCTPGRAIVIPHHTNMDSSVREGVVREDGRPFWCAMHFSIPSEQIATRLIEIVQTRGCFETEEVDADWGVDAGGFGGSGRTALNRGYRLGFVGGSDNHTGWPTRKGAGYCGLTAIQAPQLNTQTLFNSLYCRQCYATSGARIVADATLNGYPMGSEIQSEPGEPREMKITIKGTTPIVTVQIVHCGYILAELPVGKDSLDFYSEWADERPGRPLQDVYYYVRARQADGHCVWLSPFWIDLPK